jgi:Putative transmembrane protein (Alph_Pro_TM)
MKTTKTFMLSCLMLLSLIIPISAQALQVTPEEMLVSTTYNGKDVLVTGEIEADEEAVVQIIGTSSEADFKRYGKVGGVLWMTVAHLAIADAPAAYFVYLPETISSWRESKDDRWLTLNLDYDSLRSEVKIIPEPADKDVVFNDFLQLKKHDGLYQMVDNAVRYDAVQNGKKPFHTTIHVPAKMPITNYEIKVTRVKNGTVAGIDKAEFRLKQTGFPLLVSNLAFNHSLIFGILAVAIAIFAGLFMGFLFQEKGGGAH